MSRGSVYRTRDSDPAFAEAWQEALDLAVDELEGAAFQLALSGDARLTEFMLKSHRPQTYRETQRHDIAVVGGIVLIPQKTEGAE